MTRINVVPVKELCDQHLFAEFRELTRIPNGVVHGILKPGYPGTPTRYTLGVGHVKFFVNKQKFLYDRYLEILAELRFRTVAFKALPFIDWAPQLKGLGLWGDYEVTDNDRALNRMRICIRMPAKPRWTGREPAYEQTPQGTWVFKGASK